MFDNNTENRSEWKKVLANIVYKADGFLRYYFPVAKEHSTELDGYMGRFSHQSDFIAFRSLMRTEKLKMDKA